MLFGLALLAGLVGYAVVDPFDSADAHNDTDSDAGLDVSGDPTDSLGSLLDDPDVAENEPEVIITGTEQDDLIYGGDGDYTVNGGDGDDQLHGGDGSDTLNGEAGDDRLYAGDGIIGQSINTLNGGDGDDILYGSNEAENILNGDDGDDQIHIRGHDTATGGTGADSFIYSTEYGDGALGTITDYVADDDQIVVEYMTDETSSDEVPAPEVSIIVDGVDAMICLDGNECMIVQGAANSLAVEDILLRASPVI